MKENIYLTIYLFGKAIKLNAWYNKDRKEGYPHFKGDGVAVYVNKLKEKPQDPIEQLSTDDELFA